MAVRRDAMAAESSGDAGGASIEVEEIEMGEMPLQRCGCRRRCADISKMGYHVTPHVSGRVSGSPIYLS